MADSNQIKVTYAGDTASFDAANKRFNDGLKTSSNQVAKSGKDFTGLSRVLQDLPFGFIAISNNLTQLLPAAGAAGLAISALISAITFAQTGTSNWTRGLGDNKKVLEDAKKALDAYVDGLDDISKFRLTGAQDAQGQVVALQTLYSATQNANIPLAERKKLVDQLQDQYPAYFKNISDEIILQGGAQKAYEKLTTAIIAAATAKAGEAQIVDIGKERLIIEQQIAEAQGVQNQARQVYLEKLEAGNRAIELSKRQGQSTLAIERGINAFAVAYNRTKSASIGLQEKNNKLIERQKKIAEQIQGIISTNGAVTLGDVSDKGPKEVKVKTVKLPSWDEIMRQFNLDQLKIDVNLVPKIDLTEADRAIQRYLNQEASRIEPTNEGISAADIKRGEEQFKKWQEVQAKIKANMENMANIVSGILTPAFTGLFDAILAGQSPLQAFFQSLGQSVLQLINKLIAAALQAALLAVLLPGGGGGFTKLFGKALGFTGFARGGQVPQGFPGDSFPALLTSGEVIVPQKSFDQLLGGGLQQQSSGNMRVSIRGRELILLQAREQNAQRRGR